MSEQRMFSPEEIEEYKKILDDFKQKEKVNKTAGCWNCHCLEFYVMFLLAIGR